MSEGKSKSFTYETSRYKTLMDEYARLSSREEFAEWGKKAPTIAAYMSQTIARTALIIKAEKARYDQETDKKQKQGIRMATMQLESFYKIVKNQLDDLVKTMDNLPSGSVRAVYEDLVKPWTPKADTPYIRILVSKTGEITKDGVTTNLEALKEAVEKLAQIGGLVLYSREVEKGFEIPSVVEQILRIVADNRLPIRLCEKTDFSEAIDENGRLRVDN